MRDLDLMGADLFEFPGVEPPLPSDDGDGPQAVVTRLMEEAVNHYEEHIEPVQVKATQYYRGEPFGNETKGRSKVVSTEVRDVTLRQIPSLLRIFFSPERVVEFRPFGPEDVQLAEQQTDYVNWVVTQQNDSFRTLYEVIQDSLVRMYGITKWWWEERNRVSATEYTGLTQAEVEQLASDPDVEIEVLGVVEGEPPTMDLRITRRVTTGRERFAAVPPEEFFFTPNARDVETSPLVAHSRYLPISDVIEMGYDEEDIEDYVGRKKTASEGALSDVRQFHGGDGTAVEDRSDNRDPSQREILYTEAYVLMDGDDDGISEIRKFDCVGPGYKILNGDGEIVDERPFAVWSAYLEAHTMVGPSNYDFVGDLQLINSQILRGTLDSLAVSINPVTEIVQGEVNMQDALNTDIVKFVRVRRPGMMREVKHGFVGPDTLPILQFLSEQEEDRTGTTRASQGLDADVLQSTTKAAVTGTFSAAQQRLDMVARSLAETGMRRLFKGILGLTVKHQNPGAMFRLRGSYVPIDPRYWDTGMDVQVNIALGQGTPEDRLMALQFQLQTQMGLMQTGSPLVTNVELRATLAKLAELQGWRNSDEFYKPWGVEEEQQAQQQAAQQQPPPDPNMMLVQVEQMKAEAEAAAAQAKIEIERMKVLLQDDRERDRTAREMALKEREIEAKYQMEINDSVLQAAVAHDRAEMDADLRAAEAEAAASAPGPQQEMMQ